MKISVQTGGVLEGYFPEQADFTFRTIAEAGFDCVDFNIDNCLNLSSQLKNDEGYASIFDLDDAALCEAFRPFKEAAAKYGVSFGQMHAPFPSCIKDKPNFNEYILFTIERSFLISEYLGCPNVIVHPFFFGYDDTMDAETEWEYNIRQYSRLIPACKKHNITICLENMFVTKRNKTYAAICQDPDEANRYIDTLNEIAGQKCFGFCLDTGHALLVGHDIYPVIKKLGDRIVALHVHDNDGHSDQHLAPYMGIQDWNRFCKALKEIHYKGTLNFETFNAVRVFDSELMPEVLSMIAATGRMFARRIEE